MRTTMGTKRDNETARILDTLRGIEKPLDPED
jgi:hypothetical protein